MLSKSLFSLFLLGFCISVLAADIPVFKRTKAQAKGTKTTSSSPKTSSKSSDSTIKEIFFNFGTHTEFYNSVQTDDSGGLRKFDFAPTVGAGIGIPLDYGWTFVPEVNWVLPQLIEDSHIMINTFMLRGDFAYSPIDWLRLHTGTSLIWLNQHGRGGTTQKNNGTRQSKFYYPDENRSSLNNTLDFGAEVLFDDFSIRLQEYTYAIFRAERRQISYTLFLTYYWDK